MKRSYNVEPSTEKVRSLGEKIIDLLVDSDVTHKEANETLETAQEMLSGLKLVK